jgi:hypothetical protein
MPGESLHEGGITVFASMGTTHIRVETVINPGNARFGKDGFDLLFPNHELSSKQFQRFITIFARRSGYRLFF